MLACDYCRTPLSSTPLRGRPWPGHAPAEYCCYGCLSLGEARLQQAAVRGPEWKLGGLGLRLGIGILVAGQSMIFGLALNLHDDVPAAARAFTQAAIFVGTLLVLALLGGPLV